MLSNTATPKYYAQFRDKVLRGEITVNEEISMQMNRIDAMIENPRYYYDDEAINGFIAFCEKELVLTDGSPMHLLDSFKLWAEDVLCWFYFTSRSVYVPNPDGHGGHYETKKTKKRLRKKQYLIVGRGAAKTMYVSSLQQYELNVNFKTTHQITTAPTMRQAEEVMSPIRTAIARARGPLYKFLTNGSIHNTSGHGFQKVQLASTKKGIQNFSTNSLLEIVPMSIDKTQGLRLSMASIDEWLSGDTREDVIGSLEQSAAKEQSGSSNDDFLIIAISSEGTVRNGPGDTIKMELMKILRGEYPDDHTSIWWYKLDSIDEVADPSMWLKANPNLGITVTYDTYQADVEKAERNPSQRNDILAKRFGLPMEGFTYYFTYDETIPHRHRDFWQMDCSLGIDLSQGDDFCAFLFLFPLANGDFGIKTRNYISELTLNKLPPAMRSKYDEFINEGTLIVMPGNILDMMQIYDDIDQYILDSDYNVISLGYDPYSAKEFIERWCRENGEYGVVKVPQGMRTETVPLGEIKKLAEERMLLFDESIMNFTMSNAIVMEDTNGNRKLLKKRYEAKIDDVSALIDAFVAYKAYREEFV